jgi:hypothetical protein
MNLKTFCTRIVNLKSLDVYLKIEGSIEEQALIRELCTFNVTHQRLTIAWGIIINAIDDRFSNSEVVTFLPDEVLEYLVNNNIALCDLGHLRLEDKWLVKIYRKNKSCIESLQTLVIRYLEHNYSLDEFVYLIKDFNSNFINTYILFYIVAKRATDSDVLEKAIFICRHILSGNTDSNELARFSVKYLEYISVLLGYISIEAVDVTKTGDYLYCLLSLVKSNIKCTIPNEDFSSFEQNFLKNELNYVYSLR